MKIFLSWSGETSRQIALALREFLPLVENAFQPWMSDEDIGKGARWSAQISAGLDESSAGIVCVTRDNLTAPWLLFEAGALAKTPNAAVCPYLFRLKPTDVTGPLSQFQSVTSVEDKEQNLKLVHALHGQVKDSQLTIAQLNESFDLWWDSKYSKRLAAIEEPDVSGAPVRSNAEMLEEILNTVRRLAFRSGPYGSTLADLAHWGTAVNMTGRPIVAAFHGYIFPVGSNVIETSQILMHPDADAAATIEARNVEAQKRALRQVKTETRPPTDPAKRDGEK